MTLKQWLTSLNLEVGQIELVQQAFTHSSFVNESQSSKQDNERLEFIGDSVLQLWSADFLYHVLPELSEGQMTLLRAQLVCEESLAQFARQLKLDQFLLLGFGERKNGGATRNSTLADAFEAFIGALYLDGNYENVSTIFKQTVINHYQSLDVKEAVDYKTRLQEFVQSDSRKTVAYELISSSGPSNNPTFVSQVVMDGLILGKGIGQSKKKSQQAAAKDALEKLVK